MDLDTLSKLAPIASAVIAFIAAIFISIQLVYTRRNREADVFLKIISLSDSDRMTDAKDWLLYDLNKYPSVRELKADRDGWKKFSDIVHLFETMGVLVNHGYIPKTLVFDKYGLLIVGAWHRLHTLISSMRNDTHAYEYAENFQLLVSEYDEWAKSHRLRVFEGERITFEGAKTYLDVGGKGHARIKQEKSEGT